MDNTKNKDAVISKTKTGNTILTNFDMTDIEKVKASEVNVGDFLVRTNKHLAVQLIDIKKGFDKTANEDAYTFYWSHEGSNSYQTASELVSIVRKAVAYKKYGNDLKECSDLEEAINLESDLLLKLKPISEVEIFEFMKNLRGGTYFNMGMYSSIPVSKAYKSSIRIYKVIDLTAIVSGVSYENVGTTKDFRQATGEGPGKSWYDHTPGFENKVGQKKSDPNSKYVLWDIKRGTGTCVRYYVVDIDTGAVTPVSKEDVFQSDWLTQTEKNKLTPKPVVGFDLDTGEAVENKTNWRTAAFDHIFWLNQAGKATQEYGVRFEEDFNLEEAFGDDIFMDAHAYIRTDLDAILSGEVVESVEKPLNEVTTKHAAEKHPVYVVVTPNIEHVYTSFDDAVYEAEGPLYDEAIRIESRYELPDETYVAMSKTDPYYGCWTAEEGVIVTPQIIESVEKPLEEDADIFLDAHAGARTKLDDVLSGGISENLVDNDKEDYAVTYRVKSWPKNQSTTVEFTASSKEAALDTFWEYVLDPESYDEGEPVLSESDFEILNLECISSYGECYKQKGLQESYRRTVSRGAALVDNELFVDFD